MKSTTGYKLFNLRKDGTIGPLFINRKLRLQPGKWYSAEDHPTKGYQHRPGWHATLKPVAPHLCERGRVWAKVELSGIRKFNRPQSQGGTWVLAKRLKVVEVYANGLPKDLWEENISAALDLARSPVMHIGFESDGKLYISWRTTGANRHFVPVRSLEDFRQFGAVLGTKGIDLDKMYFGCSSSVDFPEEYTDDQSLIELCRELRS